MSSRIGLSCWLAAVLLVLATAVRADVCAGRVHEPVESAPVTDAVFSQGLLFRVQREDGPPSFVFGTMHLPDADVVRLPPAVDQALRTAHGFVMEVLFTPETGAELAGQMFYTDGTRLNLHLQPAMYERTAELLERHHITAAVAALMKPWAAYMTLNFPPDEGGAALDLVLLERARKAGKALYGLESMAEQIDVLAGSDPGDMLELLRDTVCNYALVQAQLLSMKERYLQRDLAGLLAMVMAVGDDDAVTRRLLDRLLWQRNQRMAKRLLHRLDEGHMFIAVGALHLPGEQGVLALLEQRGYRVEVVY